MAIYPELSSIVIANCTKPEHLAASVLHFPVFRVCRQIRAECLSYICANFSFKFLGLQTAVLFFSCAGTAVSEIKAFVLVQSVVSLSVSGEDRDRIERFFAAIDVMDRLVEVRLVETEIFRLLVKGGEHDQFITRVKDLSERGVDVHSGFRRERAV
jgi:uncharacterized protein YecE (DUF72 family)